MSNQNMPTTPDDTGNWYREGGEIVKVELNKSTNLFSGLVYYRHGSQYAFSVAPDGLWRGPVPMPGEFVLIPKQSEPDGHTRSFAFQVVKDTEGNYVATDLPPMEPIYDPEKWYSFTWDRNTGEMTPRETDTPEEPR